jgi:hypothetical protein
MARSNAAMSWWPTEVLLRSSTWRCCWHVDYTPFSGVIRNSSSTSRPGVNMSLLLKKRAPKGMTRSRWLYALGTFDQVVEYFKPQMRPEWMSDRDYPRLPESIRVREVRYRISGPGFRTREVTLVTTLMDAEAYPAQELARAYGLRWQVEINWVSCRSARPTLPN